MDNLAADAHKFLRTFIVHSETGTGRDDKQTSAKSVTEGNKLNSWQLEKHTVTQDCDRSIYEY